MKNKFKVGDRVKHKDHLATIVWIGNIDCIIRYDDHKLGWAITKADHDRGYHTSLELGGGYYWVDSNEIKFVSRPKKRNIKPISKPLEKANKAAIKEQVEQEEVIRLTNDFIQKLKEA